MTQKKLSFRHFEPAESTHLTGIQCIDSIIMKYLSICDQISSMNYDENIRQFLQHPSSKSIGIHSVSVIFEKPFAGDEDKLKTLNQSAFGIYNYMTFGDDEEQAVVKRFCEVLIKQWKFSSIYEFFFLKKLWKNNKPKKKKNIQLILKKKNSYGFDELYNYVKQNCFIGQNNNHEFEIIVTQKISCFSFIISSHFVF